MQVGDIAFLHGLVPVHVKEILQHPNEVHYEIEILHKIVSNKHLELRTAKKAGDNVIPVNDIKTNHKKGDAMDAKNGRKEIPNGGSTEAKRIEANNSIEIEQNDPVKPTRKRKRPEPKKDVILLPWINESTLLNETTKTVSVVEQVTGTPCSQVSGNESCMEGQLSDPPPMVCSDRHQIVRLKELTYYKTGKGEFTKAPANACRICKRSRSFWACLNCSEDTRPFPIHHPTVNPQCYQKHIKEDAPTPAEDKDKE